MQLNDARRLAHALLAEHGLDAWTFSFDRAKRRAGLTTYASRTISLSAPLTRLHDEEEVRETLLHEIAHALAGPKHGHDAHWRAIARRIGSNGERCLDAATPRVLGAWVGTCRAGHTTDLHRRPQRVRACSRCRGPFAERVFTWTHHGAPAAMHPRYLAELAAIRGRAEEPAGAIALLPVGAEVRIAVPGVWQGVPGAVQKRGRTRYHLATARGVVTVPFAGVEPLR